MRLLIFEWNNYLQYDIHAVCIEKGIRFESFSWKFQAENEDEKFEKSFEELVAGKQYDAVFSINYFPMISKMCQRKELKYISWCCDAPLNLERIEETLGNPVNYVFLFDRNQYLNYKNAGFDTVYHLPLGVNKTRLEQIRISGKERERYAADVSFIGALYESRLQDVMAPMNDYTKGYLNSLMDIQINLYGYYLFDEMITEELIKDINEQYRLKNPNTKFQLVKEALTFAMASEITRKSRIVLLSLCGKYYDTKFYSYQEYTLLKEQGVKKCPTVDYIKEMPKIFACSKINLNPSLRCIQTGIPLRALDIMGAGGFLLSNYQEELVELYEHEKEMVVYESFEDAMDKIDFYVKHDNLREEIVRNGRQKTLEEHNMQSRMDTIFSVAGI